MGVKGQAAIEYFVIALISALAAIWLANNITDVQDSWNDEVNNIANNATNNTVNNTTP